MFGLIKRRLQDMATIKALCEGAEKHANREGQQQPGAEHFVLAALELPDGTAGAAFRRLAMDPSQFGAAIETQYREALLAVGMDAQGTAAMCASGAVPPAQGAYQSKASGQVLVQQLSQQDKAGLPLQGAHVLLAAASAQYGVTARALRSMGIEPARLAEAARAELSAA